MDKEQTEIEQTSLPAPQESAQKRGRGRPKKSEILAKKKPGKRGRPKGDTAIMAEYKARMLASPKSEAIIHKVLNTALDDGHPHQAACMKMVWDRLLPASYFEKDKFGGKTPQIDININIGDHNSTAGVNISSDEPIDGEFVDVRED